MNLFPIYHLSLDFNIFEFVDNILTGLALWLAYWQFRKQNEENRSLQRQQNEKNWYVSVIVVPQIDTINRMFSTLIDEVKNGHNEIIANSQNLVLKASKQSACKRLVESYLEHIVQMVSSFDRTTGTKISQIEMNLQDETTNMLERNALSEMDVRSSILKYNGELFTALFQCSKKSVDERA